MPTHVRWGSIELLHNVIRTLNYLKERDGTPLPTVTYRAKVKLHGNNAAVQITDEGVFPQSRTQLLTPEDDLKGFAKWVLQGGTGSSASDHLRYFENLAHITIFGEWCGPGVQKKVALKDIVHKIFAVFALQVEDRILYDPVEIESYLHGSAGWIPKEMHILPWYGEDLTLDFGGDLEATIEKLNEWVLAIEEEDPWVKEVFGVSGRGEGLVFYPVGKDVKTDPESLEVLMFKAKGVKHQTNKTRKPVQVDPEVIEGADQFAALMVTEARLEQGVDEATGGEFDIKRMGQFIRWITEDVQKESVAELEVSGLTWAQVNKAVQGAAREWYKAKALG